MRTTMKNVAGMVETAAETMSTLIIVLYANVWIQMAETMEQQKHQLNHQPNLQLNPQLMIVIHLNG